ncbi:hypothetical protein Mapa_015918 [Marchantia paleacea]|nr:hypothetical protein Mapa_015918 [Marchantia paleacea]
MFMGRQDQQRQGIHEGCLVEKENPHHLSALQVGEVDSCAAEIAESGSEVYF